MQQLLERERGNVLPSGDIASGGPRYALRGLFVVLALSAFASMTLLLCSSVTHRRVIGGNCDGRTCGGGVEVLGSGGRVERVVLDFSWFGHWHSQCPSLLF